MTYTGGSEKRNVATPLPREFAELEAFDAWALDTSTARNRKRLASTMEEIQGFYDAMFPRIEAVLAYLDQFPLDAMPPEAERLMMMALSLAEISSAVELFGNPRVTGGCDPGRFVVVRELTP